MSGPLEPLIRWLRRPEPGYTEFLSHSMRMDAEAKAAAERQPCMRCGGEGAVLEEFGKLGEDCPRCHGSGGEPNR